MEQLNEQTLYDQLADKFPIKTNFSDGYHEVNLKLDQGVIEIVARHEPKCSKIDTEQSAGKGLREKVKSLFASLSLYDLQCRQAIQHISLKPVGSTERDVIVSWKQTSGYTGPIAMPGEVSSGLASPETIYKGSERPISQDTIDFLGRTLLRNS
jgi:hypothetical protein